MLSAAATFNEKQKALSKALPAKYAVLEACYTSSGPLADLTVKVKEYLLTQLNNPQLEAEGL